MSQAHIFIIDIDGDTIWVMYVLQPLNFLCTLLKKILDKLIVN